MKRLEIKQGQLFSMGKVDFSEALKDISVNQMNSKTVYFPDVDGKLAGFIIRETPVMAAELSAKYPSIRSYTGYRVDKKEDKIRFSVSHNGIQAMIIHGNGKSNTFMQKLDGDDYIVYSRDSFQKKEVDFICRTTAKAEQSPLASSAKPVDGQVLRKFRLAISATGEYSE